MHHRGNPQDQAPDRIAGYTAPPWPWRANRDMVLAVGAALAAHHFLPAPTALWWEWVPTVLCGLLALRFGAAGLSGLVTDYRLRRRWDLITRPVSGKSPEIGPAFAERKAAGLYDPNGPLIGWDLEHDRPLYWPDRLKPSFRYVQGGSGTGKTTASVVAGSILGAVYRR